MGGQQQGGGMVAQPSGFVGGPQSSIPAQPFAPAPGIGPGFGGGQASGVPRPPFGAPFSGAQTGFSPAQNLGALGNQPGVSTPAWQPNAANQWQSGPPAPIGMSAQTRPPAALPPQTPAVPNMQGGPQMGGSAASTGLSPQPMNIFGSLTGGGAGKF